MTTATIKVWVCDNCPSKPSFTTTDALAEHWKLTHTVSMVITEVDPWGQRPTRTRNLFHVEEIPVG